MLETKCKHYFHKKCLSGWFECGNNTCPMCRKQLNHFEEPDYTVDSLEIDRSLLQTMVNRIYPNSSVEITINTIKKSVTNATDKY